MSNVAIANVVGTRNCKQVGVFKRSFLLKNPNWIRDNMPPVPQLRKVHSLNRHQEEVRTFYGWVLNNLEWDEFCQTLLCWAAKLRDLVVSSQPRPPHPTAGWSRRRNLNRRSPPPSLINTSNETATINASNETATPTHAVTAGETRAGNHRRASGRQRDVAKARQLQRLYRTNPSVCIRKILDDTPPSYCAIAEADFVSHFTAMYSAANPLGPPPSWLISRLSHEDVLEAPFSSLEIQRQLSKEISTGR
ncbi:hypothetical protein EMCRGX_G005269 [Ephydatia muelleri]